MKLLQFLLYLLIFSFCLGQFGKIPIGGGEVGIYLWDILAVALVFYWLALKFGVEKRFDLPPLWAPILLFSFISLITLISGFRWLEVGEWMIAAAYWVRWVIYTGVYFVVSDTKRSTNNQQSTINNLLIASGVVLAVLGFVQLIVFPNLSDLNPSLGWDPHQGRMVSTWLDPNFVGAYFVLCLSLLTGKVLSLCHSEPSLDWSGRGEESHGIKNLLKWDSSVAPLPQNDEKRKTLVLTTYYLILLAALILTFSRSAWAMFAIVIGVFGIFKSRKLLVLMVVIFFGAYFFVPRVQTRIAGVTDPADSASLRLVSWQRTFEIIKKHPLTGVGFNAFRYAQEREGFFRDGRGVPMTSGHSGAGSDSSLLLVWATTGIFGLLSYFWLYGSIAWRVLKQGFFCRHSGVSPRTRGDDRIPLSKEFIAPPRLGGWASRVTGDYHKFLSLPILASLAGLLIESNFINSLFYPPILLWLWIVTGLAADRA